MTGTMADMLPDMLIGAAFKERLRQGSTRL